MTSPRAVEADSPMPPEAATPPRHDAPARERSGLRDTLPLLLANLWHGVSGFLIFVVAARVMEAGEFGRLSLVMAIALAVEEFVKQGIPRAVSHHVARATGGAEAGARGAGVRAIVGRGVRVNLAYAAGGAAFVAVLAWPLGRLFDDGGLGWLLAVGALDMVVFAPYTIWLATLNGLHAFDRQAIVMAAYSTQKAGVLIAFVVGGGTAWHGVAGYLVGSTLGSIIAWLMVRRTLARGEEAGAVAGEASAPPRLSRVGLPLAMFGVLMALFLNVDFAAFRAGLEVTRDAMAPAAALDPYAGAVHIARMVFFVFLAFGEALFPSISRVLLHEARHVGATRVRASLGALALLLVPSIALGAATGGATARVLFGEAFAASGDYLPSLLVLAGLLVVAHTLASAVAASGGAWRVFVAMGAGLAANVAGNALLVGVHPLAPPVVAAGAALVMLAILLPAVCRAFGGRWVPWLAMPGAVVAGAVAWVGGRAVVREDALLFASGAVVMAGALVAGWGLTALVKRVARPRSQPSV